MVRINDLSDELLIKILTYLPTKAAVSTSILSKQWEFLWMWLPRLEYDDDDFTGAVSSYLRYRDFIDKNLPLHRAPVIESLLLRFCRRRLPQPEKIKQWVVIAVSRFVRELSIDYCYYKPRDLLSLPSSLYTCVSLTTLKLQGPMIFLDVPPAASLPCLKTLQLRYVKYSNQDSLRLLLSHCPVLEDLLVERNDKDDNLRKMVVNVPSLQRLSLVFNAPSLLRSSLKTDIDSSCGGCSIVTPSLKYFNIKDRIYFPSYLIEPMPKLEDAYIYVSQYIGKFLKSITPVKRLSINSSFDFAKESVYRSGIVFNQLEHLKLSIYNSDWCKLLVWFLRKSPKLRFLSLSMRIYTTFVVSQPFKWSSIPECLLRSLETFEFSGYTGEQQERDCLSFFFKHARCLKSTSITDREKRVVAFDSETI